jgi:hypothetical protein
MLSQHQHKPEEFDPGHCPTCARQAGLLDHYDRVQREETRLRQTRAWAYAAHRCADRRVRRSLRTVAGEVRRSDAAVGVTRRHALTRTISYRRAVDGMPVSNLALTTRQATPKRAAVVGTWTGRWG